MVRARVHPYHPMYKTLRSVRAIEFRDVMVDVCGGVEPGFPDTSQPVPHIGPGLFMRKPSQVVWWRLPFAIASVPAGLLRTARSKKVELEHMTGLIGDIADTRMFDINRCQQASARFHIFRDVDEWVIGLGDVIMVVGSGDGPRRTSLRGCILGKVEQEQVPGHTW